MQEIPSSENRAGSAQPTSGGVPVSASTPKSAPTSTDTVPSSVPTLTVGSHDDQAKIAQLVALGFSEQQARVIVENFSSQPLLTSVTCVDLVLLKAVQALQTCNGNVEMAAGLLFESM